MKDAKIEIFPFGVFLSPLLLNKPVSVVLRSVIAPLNRNAPLNPISPATSAFPYSTLFGFVNVAGLIPTSTRTTKGMLAPGVRVYTGSITLNAGASCALPHKVAGLLFIKNGYSWSGYNMYHIYRTTVNLLGAPDGTNPISAISASGVL